MFMTRPKKVMTGLIWRHKQDSFNLSVSTLLTSPLDYDPCESHYRVPGNLELANTGTGILYAR
jgi:hypothetical protein